MAVETPRFTLSGPVLDAPDPQRLAGFYRRLLGWPVQEDSPEWVVLRSPAGGQLSFQAERAHVPPVWPAGPGDQQMQLHLDIEVDDLAAATARAAELGAVQAEFQPQAHVRVMLDPAGHPFCLWVREGS